MAAAEALCDWGAQDAGLPVLYLIDEIYRGTNNRERLVGSRAFIKEVVGRTGAGLLATHDLELIRTYPTARVLELDQGRLVFDSSEDAGGG